MVFQFTGSGGGVSSTASHGHGREVASIEISESKVNLMNNE